MTSPRNSRHSICVTVTEITEYFRDVAKHWRTATSMSLCASIVRRCLLCGGMHAKIFQCRILMVLDYRHFQLQWATNKPNNVPNGNKLSSQMSHYNMNQNDGRARVRCHKGDSLFSECLIHRHTSRKPSVMV